MAALCKRVREPALLRLSVCNAAFCWGVLMGRVAQYVLQG